MKIKKVEVRGREYPPAGFAVISTAGIVQSISFKGYAVEDPLVIIAVDEKRGLLHIITRKEEGGPLDDQIEEISSIKKTRKRRLKLD